MPQTDMLGLYQLYPIFTPYFCAGGASYSDLG